MSFKYKKVIFLSLFLLGFCLLVMGSVSAESIQNDTLNVIDDNIVEIIVDSDISEDRSLNVDHNTISEDNLCENESFNSNLNNDSNTNNSSNSNITSNSTSNTNNSSNSNITSNSTSNMNNTSNSTSQNNNATSPVLQNLAYDNFCKDIKNANSKTTVYLNEDIVFNKNNAVITLTKGIVIDGKNHVIDANGVSAIFNTKYALTIKNLILKNANGTCGGAIYDRGGAVTIENCSFINNSVTGIYGGAIYVQNGNLIVKNSLFENNFLFTSNSEGKGGAIYLINSNSQITKTTFNNNSAISSRLKNHSDATSYKFNGGAIYYHSGSSHVLTDDIFICNSVSNHGASMYAHSECKDLKITSCVFEKNKSLFEDGGAISFDGSKLTLSKSKFINNFAFEDGGAIDSFSTNKADVVVNINDCLFDLNTAYKGAGAIWLGVITKFTIKNTNFTNNKASVAGALYTEGKSASLTNCLFKNNTAAHITEWIELSKSGEVIEHCGGAIYNPVSKDVKLTNCIIQYNTAVHGGGIYYGGGNTILTNCDISHNAAENGGAISGKGTLTVKSSKLNYNNANVGGAIFNKGTLTVSGTTMKSNTATTSGGAIYAFSGKTTITSSTITSNTATNGGAISGKGTLTVKSSKLNKNKATYGGAIFLNGGTFTVSSNTIESNSANNGGAVFHNGGKLTVSSNIIKSNSASKSGGGIYYKTGTISVKGNAIISNKAKTSSGVHAVKKISVDNNWWGNTKSNSKKAPSTKVVNVKAKSWLYLKISASPAKIAKGKKTTITLDLRYTNKNKKVTSSAKLPVTLTGKSGTIGKSTSISKGLAKIKFKKTGKTGKVTANVLGTKVSVKIK